MTFSWEERDAEYERLREEGWCPDHAADQADYHAHDPEEGHVEDCTACQNYDD